MSSSLLARALADKFLKDHRVAPDVFPESRNALTLTILMDNARIGCRSASYLQVALKKNLYTSYIKKLDTVYLTEFAKHR